MARTTIHKLLIANRAEIAVRIIRTAKELGIGTVAVFSTADAETPHVALADEAVGIGPAPVSQSYLRGDVVIQAAKRTGADAIHPGYGLLSENAAFASACADSGIIFVGPTAAAIELMGDKAAAKRAMRQAGVPCVPGYEGQDQKDDTLRREAETIGYPLMVKAAGGGGGRGMRLVSTDADLADALRAARAEAMSAFGNDELILEKAVTDARHVEIQVFADTHGNVIHLGERDCSVQRRHQKVIEECPSPAVDEALRQKMGDAAVEAARACGYVGAGTVEFLLDADGAFYFLEMNTRLQVEHPVTEMVTGVDLVAWQLAVASGAPLPFTQSELQMRGHAIEARLYAEDPSRDYLPQTGALLRWRPSERGVRVDSGVAEGGVVSPFYDPMIAKVIAHGDTRQSARHKLAAALRDSTLFGLVSNKAFLADVLDHEVFVAGDATTRFLDDDTIEAAPIGHQDFALAALARMVTTAARSIEDATWLGWRNASPIWTTVELETGHDPVVATRVDIRATGRGARGQRFEVTVWSGDGVPSVPSLQLDLVSHDAETMVVALEGVERPVRYAVDDTTVWLDFGGAVRRLVDITHRPKRAADGKGSGRLVAPLDGAVMKTFAEAGAVVAEGQLIAVIEAMKMEHRIVADVSGTLTTLAVSAGDQVRTRQLLAEITPEGDA
jgi:geranyl-CoA carboxylase alpha subunit